MKNVLLIRHAKSSWSAPHLADVDRPLNKRGKRDGAYMPSYLRSVGIIIDFIVSSHANRAFSTAKFFAKEFKDELTAVNKSMDLYFGSLEDWMYEINSLEENVHFPAFFSHNPNITYLANSFTKNFIENVPTCGVVHLISSAKLWQELDYDNTNVKDLYFPKLIRE